MEGTTLTAIGIAIPLVYEIGKELVKGITGSVSARNKAKIALSLALDTTETYLLHIGRGGDRNQPYEKIIGSLWHDAYLALKPLYPEGDERLLAIRLKSKYWDAPEKWSDSGIKTTAASLSKVRQYFKRHIKVE